MGIGNNAVLAINCAMVQPEEPLRFVISMHKTAFRVGSTDFSVFDFYRR
jgi:hypothetical protein